MGPRSWSAVRPGRPGTLRTVHEGRVDVNDFRRIRNTTFTCRVGSRVKVDQIATMMHSGLPDVFRKPAHIRNRPGEEPDVAERADVVSLLQTLLRFDTTNRAPGDAEGELAAATWIHDLLGGRRPRAGAARPRRRTASRQCRRTRQGHRPVAGGPAGARAPRRRTGRARAVELRPVRRRSWPTATSRAAARWT